MPPICQDGRIFNANALFELMFETVDAAVDVEGSDYKLRCTKSWIAGTSGLRPAPFRG